MRRVANVLLRGGPCGGAAYTTSGGTNFAPFSGRSVLVEAAGGPRLGCRVGVATQLAVSSVSFRWHRGVVGCDEASDGRHGPARTDTPRGLSDPPPRSRWHGRAIFELPSDLQPILGEVAEDPVMPTLLSQMQEEAVGGETVARWARRTALLRKGIARVVRDRRAWGSPIRGGQHPCVGGAGRRGHHHRGRHRSRHGGAQAQNACLARMHSSICDTHDRHSLVMVQAPRSPTCSKHHRRSKTRRSRS